MATIPDFIVSQFANSGDRAIPPQTDPLGFVNFTNGYTPDYEIDLSSGNINAKAVERTIQNYMFYLLTGLGKAWQEKSISPWYADAEYECGAYVGRVSGGGLWQVWRALADNTAIDPNSAGQTQWEYTPFVFETMKSVPMPAGGAAKIIPGGQTSEVITVATDFNTLNTGVWEYRSDAIANGSPNAPVLLGASTSYAGMLEAKQWANGGNTYSVQRYTDRMGVSFFRGATNGSWTSWTNNIPTSDYSVDTGVANAVQGNALLASSVLTDNQRFWVKIAANNTGATTFSPSPSVAPKALVGQALLALQGGELVANGRALIVYKADTDNFALVFCAGGVIQGPTPPQFDNDKSVVNSEFVQRALGNHAGVVGPLTVSTNITAAHAGCVVVLGGSGSGLNAVLPLLSSVPPGFTVTFISGVTATWRVVTSGSDLIAPNTGTISSFNMGPGDCVTMVSDNRAGNSFWRPVGGSSQLQFSDSFSHSTFPGPGGGWQKFPNGLILQWAIFSTLPAGANSAGGALVNLPIAFPNGKLFAGISMGSSGFGGGSIGASTLGSSLSQITVFTSQPSTQTAYLWALGF
ncbi:hypothetical protein PLUTO_00970 [Luteibacter phage vB_LflM-Pluto]|uniref:Putative tail fiber protein gp53-like C-terminal domain-containing protein n=1 Tax=Luteibacter phage vB_LflM-Pluto TaxID=2948611 RepID=A0A9E7MTH9_9CAUD|nr:hypothetical protein PLUTO_00970 [Luteibacter phage vB_LflM-Pluto]